MTLRVYVPEDITPEAPHADPHVLDLTEVFGGFEEDQGRKSI